MFEGLAQLREDDAPTTVPGHVGHRERLKQRFKETQGTGLADYELLELLLMFAIPRRDTKPLAKLLLHKFGNFRGLMEASEATLLEVEGMGPNSVLLLGVIHEFRLRLKRQAVLERPVLSNQLVLLDYLYAKFEGKEREECHVLYMDAQLHMISDERLFAGTLSEVNMSPRDVLKRALELNAAGIIVTHNHPSGSPKPSAADMQATEAMLHACQQLGVTLHDHLIIGTDSHYSFRAGGWIK